MSTSEELRRYRMISIILLIMLNISYVCLNACFGVDVLGSVEMIVEIIMDNIFYITLIWLLGSVANSYDRYTELSEKKSNSSKLFKNMDI